MGDMADMCMWDERDLWDDGDEPLAPALITCRYCQTPGLEWRSVDGKWRLHTRAGKMHACKVKPLPEPPKPRVITDPVEKAFRAGYDAGYSAAMDEAFPDVGPGPIKGDAWKDYKKTL